MTPRHHPQSDIDALLADDRNEIIDRILFERPFLQRIADMVYGHGAVVVTDENERQIWNDAIGWLHRPAPVEVRFTGTPAEQAEQLEAMLNARA